MSALAFLSAYDVLNRDAPKAPDAGHPARIGILGGLGPLASALFQQRLVKAWARIANARDDADYPQILHYSGALPGLDAEGVSAWLPLLGASSSAMRLFEVFGPNIIAIPCNSFLELAPTLEKRFRVPVLSPWRCAPTPLDPSHVAVLCSASLRSQLRQVMPNLLFTSDTEQLIVQKAIDQIMAGRNPKADDFQKLIEKFIAQGATQVRLACTELSCLQLPYIPQVLDTMDCLVEGTVRAALNLKQK